MSVKIIVGYLRLLQRVLQHYHLEHLTHQPALKQEWQKFYEALAQEPEQGFDLLTYVQLIRQVQGHFTRPVSLILAEHAGLQDTGLVGYLASTSLNLQQALHLLEQYYPLVFKQTNLERLKIIEQDRMIQIVWQASYAEYQEIYELNLALIFRIAKLIVEGQLKPPLAIELGLLPVFALSHYEKFFGCSIRVHQGQYKISFDEQVLQTRSFAADQHLNQVLSSQARQSLQQTDTVEHRQQQFEQKITGLIEQALKQKIEGVQQYVAQQLHCSERTLQRQLKVYGLGFQDLLDKYRLQQSKLYLQQGRTLAEVAELLGYADQSAFGRAFKRWTGYTPKQFISQ